MLSPNCDRPVVASSITFPSPAAYDDYHQAFDLFGQGPWFHQGALELGNIIEKCAIGVVLTGNIRVSWTNSWVRSRHYECTDDVLIIQEGHSRRVALAEFVRLCFYAVGRMLSGI